MTLRFSAYPPDKIDRSEARQEQAGNENWADDRFRSIKREVTRNPHEWEQGGGNRFEGDLQQFDGGFKLFFQLAGGDGPCNPRRDHVKATGNRDWAEGSEKATVA